MRTFRLFTVFLFLTVLFATSWRASAATWREKRVAPKRTELALPAILSHAWTAIEGVLTKAGCNIDPHGICVSEPAPIHQATAGCNIDPSGRCSS